MSVNQYNFNDPTSDFENLLLSSDDSEFSDNFYLFPELNETIEILASNNPNPRNEATFEAFFNTKQGPTSIADNWDKNNPRLLFIKNCNASLAITKNSNNNLIQWSISVDDGESDEPKLLASTDINKNSEYLPEEVMNIQNSENGYKIKYVKPITYYYPNAQRFYLELSYQSYTKELTIIPKKNKTPKNTNQYGKRTNQTNATGKMSENVRSVIFHRSTNMLPNVDPTEKLRPWDIVEKVDGIWKRYSSFNNYFGLNLDLSVEKMPSVDNTIVYKMELEKDIELIKLSTNDTDAFYFHANGTIISTEIEKVKLILNTQHCQDKINEEISEWKRHKYAIVLSSLETTERFVFVEPFAPGTFKFDRTWSLVQGNDLKCEIFEAGSVPLVSLLSVEKEIKKRKVAQKEQGMNFVRISRGEHEMTEEVEEIEVLLVDSPKFGSEENEGNSKQLENCCDDLESFSIEDNL